MLAQAGSLCDSLQGHVVTGHVTVRNIFEVKREFCHSNNARFFCVCVCKIAASVILLGGKTGTFLNKLFQKPREEESSMGRAVLVVT